MSRIRVVAARLYAAFIHAQLFVMSCRSKLTKFLLLIPMMLLPKAVLADGDLAD
ncbi:TPA: IncI1-type conjugal transfer protein TraR, partial [Escherichia coli]|nr:IncI1-type conjugal transfer protein TraR [Escherichia coli]